MTTYAISPEIREEIAKAIVAESAPDYDTRYMGSHYAVDTDGDRTLDAVMIKQETAPWAPWSDQAIAIPVADLFVDSAATFDPTPDTDLLEAEEDGSLNYDEIAAEAWRSAVDLALGELPETYTPTDEPAAEATE